jgi:imidazolonepropionase-like amidohydrolase
MPVKSLVCLLLLLSGSQRNLQAQTDSLSGQQIIKAKGYIDVRNGKMVAPAVIYIKNGIIEKIGSNLPGIAGVRTLDLNNLYLLPGLVDAHSHLCHEYHYELEAVRGSNIVTETVMQSDADRALTGAANAWDVLRAGFTTVRDLGNSGNNTDVALRNAINRNRLKGPRIFASTRALAPVGGQFYQVVPDLQRRVVSREYVEVSGAGEARKAVRQAIFDGADCIKVIVNNNRLSLDADELSAIVEEAKRAGLPVAAHATNGDGPALLAIRAGVNSIEHGYTLSEEVLKLMAKQGIYLVPTDAPGVERYQQRIRRALAAGVKIAFGSDIYYVDKQKNRGEIITGYRSYQAAGMNAVQILQSATMHPGALIAGEGKIGLLESGYFADIIGVEENPLGNIQSLEKIMFVMKNGVVIR